MITWNDERGTTAVEFAIVGPVFIALVVGILYLSLCLFLIGSLHYAVEEGARCASVRTAVCSDGGVAYAKSRYFGPGSPAFTPDPTPAPCGGHSVTGKISYVAQLGLTQFTIPFTASACYP
jgi:hypothetical protein